MALTNEVYFCGYHPEHFTGWGGSGKAVYASFTNSDSTEPHNIGYTTIDNSVANQTWGYGCLWGSFMDNSGAPTTLNDFYVGAELNLWNPVAAYGGGIYWPGIAAAGLTAQYVMQYAPMVIHTQSGKYLVLKRVPDSANGRLNTNTYIGVYLTPDLSDFSQYIDLNMRFVMREVEGGDAYGYIAPSNCPPSLVSFAVTGAGTSNGTIAVKITNLYLSQTLTQSEQTWTGDLTAYSDFSAVSFHSAAPDSWPSGVNDGSTLRNVGSRVYFCFVTNFDTRDAYLDYSYATTAGSETGWSGDLTTFSTFPTNYFGFGGLYATAAGQTETLKFNAAFTPDVGLEPKVLIASSGAVTDSASTVADVAVCIKDPSTGNIVNGTPLSVNDLGQEQKWIFSTDILKNASWTTTNINSYEFGLTRTK